MIWLRLKLRICSWPRNWMRFKISCIRSEIDWFWISRERFWRRSWWGWKKLRMKKRWIWRNIRSWDLTWCLWFINTKPSSTKTENWPVTSSAFENWKMLIKEKISSLSTFSLTILQYNPLINAPLTTSTSDQSNHHYSRHVV